MRKEILIAEGCIALLITVTATLAAEKLMLNCTSTGTIATVCGIALGLATSSFRIALLAYSDLADFIDSATIEITDEK